MRAVPRDPKTNQPLIGLVDYSVASFAPDHEEEKKLYEEMSRELKGKKTQRSTWGAKRPTKEEVLRSSSVSLRSSFAELDMKKVEMYADDHEGETRPLASTSRTDRPSSARGKISKREIARKRPSSAKHRSHHSDDDAWSAIESPSRRATPRSRIDKENKSAKKKTTPNVLTTSTASNREEQDLRREIEELRGLIKSLANDNKSMKESMGDLEARTSTPSAATSSSSAMKKLMQEKLKIQREYDDLTAIIASRNEARKSKSSVRFAATTSTLGPEDADDDLLLDYEKAALGSSDVITNKGVPSRYEELGDFRTSRVSDSKSAWDPEPSRSPKYHNEHKGGKSHATGADVDIASPFVSVEDTPAYSLDGKEEDLYGASFSDASKSTKRLTISAKRLQEDLLRKAKEEEKHLKTRFKAKAIPSTTTEPLYEKQLLAQEQARREAHETRLEMLRSTEMPFNGMTSRDEERRHKEELRRKRNEHKIEMEKRKAVFKAKPIPEAVATASVPESTRPLTTLSKAQRQEEIQRRAMELLASASLPPRMQMWEKSKKTYPGTEDGYHADKPTFTPVVKKKVPDFHKQHATWTKTVREARLSTQTTTVQEFSFLHEGSARHKSEIERAKRREERKRVKAEKERADRIAREALPEPQPAKREPAMTKSAEVKLQLTQKLLQDKKEEALREQQRLELKTKAAMETSMHLTLELQKREKIRHASKPEYVSIKDIKTRPDGTLSSKAQAKSKKFLADSAKRQKFNADRIEASLKSRPHLWDRHDMDLEKEKAKQRALMKVAGAVLGSNPSKSWRKDKDKSYLFKEEEKELLYELDGASDEGDEDKVGSKSKGGRKGHGKEVDSDSDREEFRSSTATMKNKYATPSVSPKSSRRSSVAEVERLDDKAATPPAVRKEDTLPKTGATSDALSASDDYDEGFDD